MKPAGIEVILPAAGRSSRLSQPKQLVRLGDESLLRTALRKAHLFCPDPIVVLGFEQVRMAEELSGLGCRIVINNNWQEGMGSSVAAGAELLRPASKSAVIMLCDQPLLSEADLLSGYSEFAGGGFDFMAATDGKKLSPPVFVAAERFGLLAKLSGDEGLRLHLRNSAYKTGSWHCPNAFKDIDTPADLESVGALINQTK